MKISQLMLSKGFGGGERYFVDLCVELAELGHQVQAICHRQFEKLDLLTGHDGLSVVPLPVWGVWVPFAARRMEREIARFQPQVMHAHMSRGTSFGGRIRARLGIPLTSTLHNYVKLKYYVNVDRYIATTEDLRQHLVKHGISPDRIELLGYFTHLKAVESVARESFADPVFVAYGRMVEKKGFDVLLRAFARLRENGVVARLIIGGDGEERDSLHALTRELGLSSDVEFAGWINDVSAFLDRGSIFVLPSLDEPFGIVVIEAMARGKPIVSTRTQGPREVLNDDIAYLAEVGDAESLAVAMQRATEDERDRLEKAKAALSRFKTQYAKEVVMPKQIQIYESLADSAAGPSGQDRAGAP